MVIQFLFLKQEILSSSLEKLLFSKKDSCMDTLEICPICCCELSSSEETFICPDCNIHYHKECWNENEGCATYGCNSSKAATKGNLLDEQLLTPCPWCHTLLNSKIVICSNCGKRTDGFIDVKNNVINLLEQYWKIFGDNFLLPIVEKHLLLFNDLLSIWKNKNTKYYNNAIETWTIRDVKKRNIARENNLNYLEIFSNDINEVIYEYSRAIDRFKLRSE